jgi:Fe-S oxidoreductase
MSACPTYATDPTYSGPMPLTQAHRYNTDSRDGGFQTRKKVLGTESGPWKCHYAGECSRACPKGVDPAKAIQLMKRELVLDYLRLLKKRRPAPIAARPSAQRQNPARPRGQSRAPDAGAGLHSHGGPGLRTRGFEV